MIFKDIFQYIAKFEHEVLIVGKYSLTFILVCFVYFIYLISKSIPSKSYVGIAKYSATAVFR